MQKQVIVRKIAIVGAGPVGMFGALLFQHFGMDFVVVQKSSSIRAFPNASWINASTKALFTQIPGFVEQINKQTQEQKWEYYSNWRYVQTLFGYQFAVVNKFQPNIQQRLKDSELLFGQRPCHIGQNKLLKIMFGKLKNKENILLNQQISQIRSFYSEAKKKNQYLLYNKQQKRIVQAQYVIMCTGTYPKIQQILPSQNIPFKIQGESNLMHFINIYFTSDKLANKFKETQTYAMFHFIYNKKMVGILNSLSISKSGEFVLQVLNYEPFVDLLQVYEPKQIVSMMFDEAESSFAWQIINDISIISSNKWQFSGLMADRLYSSGIFLAGDSAHSIHSMVGFGINPGLHDIHQLVHSLMVVELNPKADRMKIFNNYSANRWKIDFQYLKQSLYDYQATKFTAKQLGYSSSIVQIFSSNSMLKSVLSTISQKKPHYMQKIRLKALKVMSKRVKLQKPLIQLFFDQFDIFCQKPSIVKNVILKRNKQFKNQGSQQRRQNKFYTVYARQWSVTIDQIRQKYGNIDEENIKFFNDRQQPQFKHAQRLISSDGTIILF